MRPLRPQPALQWAYRLVASTETTTTPVAALELAAFPEFGELIASAVPVDDARPLVGGVVASNEFLQITGSGYAPGERIDVSVVVSGVRTALGVVVADDSGAFDTQLRVPAALVEGEVATVEALAAGPQGVGRLSIGIVRVEDTVAGAASGTCYIPPVPTSLSSEIALYSSCLAGNGRIYFNIVNTQSFSSVYRLEVTGLSAIQRTVAFEDWGRISITGRPPGTYEVSVLRDGSSILDTFLSIDCSAPEPLVSAPEVSIVNACRLDRGQMFFQFVNPTANPRPYVIEFEGVRNRSTTSEPSGL